MRKSGLGNNHPITAFIIMVVQFASIFWGLWATVILFRGGQIPLLGWETKGGLFLGLLFIIIGWPIGGFLFSIIISLIWGIEDIVKSMFYSKTEITNLTRAALQQGASPEAVIDILVEKRGFSAEDAELLVNELAQEIRD